MYECPNCGSGLKYDIATGQLLCGYCGASASPYDIQKEHDAEESDEYEATVFTCPQCGAGLLGEDNTAATFCSFCGASTVLNSRIGKGRRPVHIIPFSRTEEDCRAAYARMMRRAIFAPKELKDPAAIEKFRGIYMPYWVYSFEKKGKITFQGSIHRQKGDYLITKHYDIVSEVDASYHGISHDAAAAFSDDLSEAIAPYDMKAAAPFTPSFLSGFYADTEDVDRDVYRQDACELAVEDGFGRLSRDRLCSRYHIKDETNASSLRSALRPECTAAERVLFPVWFLSCQKDGRVAYVVVNGQTGKAAADLPIDKKKYAAGSLLLSLPLFLLLNLRFTITPGITLFLSTLLALACAVISCFQTSRIRERETYENDKGYFFARQKKYPGVSDRQCLIFGLSVTEIRLLQLLLGVLLFMFITPITIGIAALRSDSTLTMLAVFLCNIIVIRIVILKKWRKPLPAGLPKELAAVLSKPAAAIVTALIVMIWNPVSDLYYYGGAVASMAAVIWTLLDIIERYNVLATRKLPQFNRRGGDENV